MNKKHIIILGAGYTGVMCALRLHGKLRGHGYHVVLIDSIARQQKKPRTASADDIERLPIMRRLLDDSGIEYVDMPVAAIKDDDNKVVLISGISLNYDYLIDASTAATAIQCEQVTSVFSRFLVTAVTGASIADDISHCLAHKKLAMYSCCESTRRIFLGRKPTIAGTAATKESVEVAESKTPLSAKIVMALFVALLYIECVCPGFFYWPGVGLGQIFAGQKKRMIHSSLNKSV